jgi:hypothetical protein
LINHYAGFYHWGKQLASPFLWKINSIFMGQYFKPVNLDKQECLSSYDYLGGAKLMEHAWLLNSMVNAVVAALTPGGKWHGDRLVWAGDYMDEHIFLADLKGRRTGHDNLFDCTRERDHCPPCILKIRPQIPDGPTSIAILNHDRQEFIALTQLPEEDPNDPGWHIHPLPLLTCSGNGRGGGDFTGL